jgi:regulator of ribosome biosynthesis
MEDQFEKKRTEKKERIAKNKKQELRNVEKATANDKGMSTQELRQQRKKELESTMAVTRVSTASLGKFDKKADNEKAIKVKQGKRKFDEVAVDVAKEKAMATKILKKVVVDDGEVTAKGVTQFMAQEEKKKKFVKKGAKFSKKSGGGKKPSKE